MRGDILSRVSNNFSRNKERLEIVRFSLIETGTYRDLFYRPMDLTVTDQARNVVNNALDLGFNAGRSNLTESVSDIVSPTMFRGSVLEFFAPSSQVGGEVEIEEGLETPRWRWFMETIWDNNVRSHPIRQFITGYTSPMEVEVIGITDPEAIIPPDARFYVSSCFEIRTADFSSDGRGSPRVTGCDSDLILSDSDFVSRRDTRRAKRILRPSDVMQTSMLSDDLTREMESEGVYNAVGMLTDSPELSKRSDSNPVNYLSSLLNHHNRSAAMSSPDTMSEESVMSGAIVNSTRGIEGNRFLTFIRNAFDEEDSTAMFTYRDLEDIAPDIDRDVEVMFRDDVDRNESERRERISRDMEWMLERSERGGDHEDLDGAGLEDQVMAILSSTIPDLALRNSFGYMAFTVTNRVSRRDREEDRRFSNYKWYWYDFRTLTSSGEPDEFLKPFQIRVEDEVLDNISVRGDILFEVSIVVDVFNDIRIDLMIEGPRGDRERRAVFPTFLESLYNPLVSDSSSVLADISEGVRELLDVSHDNHVSRLIDPNGRPLRSRRDDNDYDDDDSRDNDEDSNLLLDRLGL